MRRVALDGWALVHAAGSPEALHVLALAAACPPEIETLLALPGPIPAWLPENTASLALPQADTAWGRLAWQQRLLPRLARRAGAEVLHSSSFAAPFFFDAACTASPVGSGFADEGSAEGFAGRLRSALGAGGLARARAVLWPADLPQPAFAAAFQGCAPFVHPALLNPGAAEPGPLLPEAFVLYHGPGAESDLRRLLAAWSWAARAIGEQYPLVAVGLADAQARLLEQLTLEYQVSESVLAPTGLTPLDLPGLYRRCCALFHPAEISPWGDPLLMALACGKPVAAAQTPSAAQRAGDAAYLAEIDSPRALGAALLTVVVDERAAESLGQRAIRRYAALQEGQPSAGAALRTLWGG